MAPDSSNEFVKNREIAVMGTLVTRQLPDTFYRIQVRAVGRQEVQLHNVPVFMQPRMQLPGMVPPRVVHNDKHFSILAAVAHELFQKQFERRGVKRVGPAWNKASVLNTYRTEKGHAFARRRMQNNGVHVFRRYPHRAA